MGEHAFGDPKSQPVFAPVNPNLTLASGRLKKVLHPGRPQNQSERQGPRSAHGSRNCM